MEHGAAHLLLVRHAHTAGNEGGDQRVLSGWVDLPLSARGRDEAAALGRALAGAPPAAALYCSPSRRAQETARALAAAHRGGIRLCDDLREIHCGEVDGLPIADVRARFGALWAANGREDDDDFRWPGGESYRELRTRAIAAAQTIAAAHPGERVLVVTHAGVIAQVVGSILGTPPGRWSRHRPATASVTQLRWAETGVLLSFDWRATARPPGGGHTRPPAG